MYFADFLYTCKNILGCTWVLEEVKQFAEERKGREREPAEKDGVEPYSKCPFSDHQSQQRIQILGYHISVDSEIRDKIFNTQNNEFFNLKKT